MNRSMRLAVAAVAVVGLAGAAKAADYSEPYLRGSDVFAPAQATYYRWSGFYFGAQAGYGNTQMDFSTSTASLIAYMLRNTSLESLGRISQWTLMGTADSRDVSYGGFIGYNGQWENVILGIELNYNRTSITGSQSDSLSRIVTPGDGFTYNVTVTSSASMHITDYGTLRGRAGYIAGRFLPYVTLGFAMGRVETFRTADVFGSYVPTGAAAPVVNFAYSMTEPKTVYAMGYAAGAGIDVALLPNLFLRAEGEWVQFTNLPDMEANLFFGRVGAGLKF